MRSQPDRASWPAIFVSERMRRMRWHHCSP